MMVGIMDKTGQDIHFSWVQLCPQIKVSNPTVLLKGPGNVKTTTLYIDLRGDLLGPPCPSISSASKYKFNGEV